MKRGKARRPKGILVEKLRALTWCPCREKKEPSGNFVDRIGKGEMGFSKEKRNIFEFQLKGTRICSVQEDVANI